MNILVTGATGFLGGSLARSLAADGHAVTGLGRSEQAGAELERGGIRFARAELADREAILAAVADGAFDLVYHCGAHSASWGDTAIFEAANIRGTANIADGCLRADVPRLVHVSTPSVYFGARDRTGVRESDPLPARQSGTYARTKLAAECEILRAAEAGLGTIMLRPRALYGPGDTSILPRIVEANGRTGVPLIGGGRALLDLTYIDDAVRALKLCASAPPEALGRVFNISGGAPVPFAEAARLLFDKLDRPLRARKLPFAAARAAALAMESAARLGLTRGEPMLTAPLVGMLGRSQTLNIDAAREVLGYRPRIRLEDGLERFARWWYAREEERRDE
ncbi:NAD(P)-dependent oxidoreductase [Saccharibacillus sp. CPCC 101409]|uniref:NAD-dependent epimerase/dehydratase family protein n=1 Tax=Saccharibacillus sp. CPCC 101409 TaxID=3058041 RepID=UPI0026741FAE|nr:NAD(P)-dependent oxidoreductase [Saccharibacillus sp. CPCC 101409]MDO3410045.1 NAD(P)-dependent oxidoreductase [Saccharibacillus sp. CPCC 101409]